MQDNRRFGHWTTELNSEHPRKQVEGSAKTAADTAASQGEDSEIGLQFEVCRRSTTAYAA
jgi:hypothetical protein